MDIGSVTGLLSLAEARHLLDTIMRRLLWPFVILPAAALVVIGIFGSGHPRPVQTIESCSRWISTRLSVHIEPDRWTQGLMVRAP